MDIHKLISEVQSELKAPKGQTNTFGKYKYRSTEDIVEAVKPILKSKGLYLNITDDIVEVGGSVFIKAIASLADGEGNFISAQGLAKHSNSQSGMSDAQVTGSTSSYARKYALNGLLAIDDTKDDDFSNDGSKGESKTPIKPTTKATPPVKTETAEETKRKEGALKAFNALKKEPEILKHLVKEERLTYSSVEAFVKGESIEKILEVYDKVK